jgi:hypothetical protein
MDKKKLRHESKRELDTVHFMQYYGTWVTDRWGEKSGRQVIGRHPVDMTQFTLRTGKPLGTQHPSNSVHWEVFIYAH